MSFRKRNVGIASGPGHGSEYKLSTTSNIHAVPLPGIRPSPVDGRPVTSTGTSTVDDLLAGHSGIALGTSLMIEESGTTDYAGALLRYFAAEGLVQGHHIQVVGLPEQWGRELPGLVTRSDIENRSGDAASRMRIAWRYENLGQFGTPASRERSALTERPLQQGRSSTDDQFTFCHTFDLTKRLEHPADAVVNFIRLATDSSKSPFDTVIDRLKAIVSDSPPTTVHRLVLPSLLSPALYPMHSNLPQYILPFMHGIRALLASYSGRLIMMSSLPLSLHPRSSGLVRWLELLSDGVLELVPFPHSASSEEIVPSTASGTQEEPPQGLLQIHRLPVFHDQGSGFSVAGEDWAFSLSRRKFTIKPFSLPPIDGDREAPKASGTSAKGKKADLDF